MKHYQPMTQPALSAVCDSYDADYQVSDLTDDKNDEREIVIYFRHNSVLLQDADPQSWSEYGEEREIIGAVIGSVVPVVLDRDQVVELIGLDGAAMFEVVL